MTQFNPVDHPLAATTRSPGNGFWFHRTVLSPLAGGAGNASQTGVTCARSSCFLCSGNVRVTGDKNPNYTGLTFSLMTLRP